MNCSLDYIKAKCDEFRKSYPYQPCLEYVFAKKDLIEHIMNNVGELRFYSWKSPMTAIKWNETCRKMGIGLITRIYIKHEVCGTWKYKSVKIKIRRGVRLNKHGKFESYNGEIDLLQVSTDSLDSILDCIMKKLGA